MARCSSIHPPGGKVRREPLGWEWQYEVPNLPTQLTHQLGIAAYTTGETFKVQYSTDGTIWYDAFSFNETVKTLKQIQLPHNTNSEYIHKDHRRGYVDERHVQRHPVCGPHRDKDISPTVQWPSSETRTVIFTCRIMQSL
jgi:hypothetical protein